MRSSRQILIIHSENAFADSRLPLIPAEASSVVVFLMSVCLCCCLSLLMNQIEPLNKFFFQPIHSMFSAFAVSQINKMELNYFPPHSSLPSLPFVPPVHPLSIPPLSEG